MTVTRRPSWVYAVRNLTTGERWIGGAADVERAWRRHQRQLREGSHKNLALQEAWETQEPDTFTVERLEEVPERAALAGRVRAWVQQESHPYNKHWYPRLRPRVIVFRDGDRVVEGTVHPPMIIHRIESAAEMGEHDRGAQDTRDGAAARDGMNAPEHPIIVAYTTYRLPFSERDLPLLVTETGIAYVPVDAWCAVLGIQLKTHLWRLRRKFLWYAARELVVNPVNPVEPIAPSAARGSASHGRGRAAQAGPPPSSTPASAQLPSWCLPRSKFLSFTSCVGWQRIDEVLHPALRAMEEEEWEEERLRMQERHQRIAAYGVQRPRILDALLVCDHILALIQAADKRLAPQIPVAEGVALTLLSTQGRQRISAYAQAARAALAQLRSGGITEYTEYDAHVDAMRTKIIPHDPTLPDVATMEAFAASEEAFASWLSSFSSFLDFIERYLPGTTFQRGSW